MKKIKQQYLWLFLILTVAFALRFYRLASYPALNADEAAIGYNAYSLLETGKDEHGNAWPIHFQSFNDYKPGLYFYMVMPFVKILGLTELAVRIPGAALGVLTVFLVYGLVMEIFGNKRQALITSMLLAISPWHIHFSRGGWEVNTATFLIVLGVYLFIRSNYLWSGLAMVASLYTYHAARVVMPLLGLGLVIKYHEECLKNIKRMVIAGVVAVLILIPLGQELAGAEVISRAAGVGLFADQGPFARINEQRGEHTNFAGLTAKILHNKVVNYGLAFFENLGEHYWGEFLFLSGDEVQRNRVPETGQLYLIELLFVLFAFYYVAKKPERWGIISWWLLVAPIGAALTFQSPHALRAHSMVIPLTIISGFGLTKIVESKRVGVIGLVGVLLLWSFVRYQRMYWLHMAKEYPFSSQYGMAELVEYLDTIEDDYEKVIVTERYDQPYILFLFYKKYPPAEFQSRHILTERDKFGFSTVREFDRYHFNLINYDQDQPNNPNSIIVGTDEEIPETANIVKEIYGSNGYKYFQVVAN